MVVNSGCFKRFWQQFQNGEGPLTRQKVSEQVSTNFDEVRVIISTQFNGISDIAIATDGLTGRRVSIWNVTARGLDKNWNFVRASLGCFPVIAQTHDNVTLSIKIKDILLKFDFRDQQIASVTTDEGGAAPLIGLNFLRALEIHCADHLLNTAQKNECY